MQLIEFEWRHVEKGVASGHVVTLTEVNGVGEGMVGTMECRLS